MKYFAAIFLVLGVVAFSTTARMTDRRNYQPSAQVDNVRAIIMKDCAECFRGCQVVCEQNTYPAAVS
jgi:hypothetical protein